jgi:hypothetical protein
VTFTGPSFSIADPTEVDAVDSGSLAAMLVAADSFFGTPAVPSIPTCIQYVNGLSAQTAVTLPSVTQAGNCLIACVIDSSLTGVGDTAPPLNSCWQLMAGERGAPNNGSSVFYVWANHPGGLQTFTWQLGLNGGSLSSVALSEFAGMPPTLAVDQFVQSPVNQNNQTYSYSGTVAPVAPNELILSGIDSANATVEYLTSTTPNSLGTDQNNNFFSWGLTTNSIITRAVSINSTPSQSSFVVLRAGIESVTP